MINSFVNKFSRMSICSCQFPPWPSWAPFPQSCLPTSRCLDWLVFQQLSSVLSQTSAAPFLHPTRLSLATQLHFCLGVLSYSRECCMLRRKNFEVLLNIWLAMIGKNMITLAIILTLFFLNEVLLFSFLISFTCLKSSFHK